MVLQGKTMPILVALAVLLVLAASYALFRWFRPRSMPSRAGVEVERNVKKPDEGNIVFRAIFSKIKQGLSKTRSLFGGVVDLFRFKGRVDQNFLNKLEERLYLADVGTVATQEILDCAYRLIVHNNPDRLEVRNGINKRLTAVPWRGAMPVHWHYETGTQEADAVAQTIREKIAAGAWKPEPWISISARLKTN